MGVDRFPTTVDDLTPSHQAPPPPSLFLDFPNLFFPPPLATLRRVPLAKSSCPRRPNYIEEPHSHKTEKKLTVHPLTTHRPLLPSLSLVTNPPFLFLLQREARLIYLVLRFPTVLQSVPFCNQTCSEIALQERKPSALPSPPPLLPPRPSPFRLEKLPPCLAHHHPRRRQ